MLSQRNGADSQGIQIQIGAFGENKCGFSAVCARVHVNGSAHGSGDAECKLQSGERGFSGGFADGCHGCTGFGADHVSVCGHAVQPCKGNHGSVKSAVVKEHIASVAQKEMLCAGFLQHGAERGHGIRGIGREKKCRGTADFEGGMPVHGFIPENCYGIVMFPVVCEDPFIQIFDGFSQVRSPFRQEGG